MQVWLKINNTTLVKWRGKSHNHFNWHRKGIEQKTIHFHDKNIQQIRNRRKFSQNDKCLCVSQISAVIKYLRKQLKVNQHFIWLTVQWLLSLIDISHCKDRITCQGACGALSSSAQAIRKPRD